MALPQNSTPPHLYPQALQIKLYQAFIFSIPILFSIILLLLFYLFYLKRRVSTVSSPSPTLPRRSNRATMLPVSSEMGLKVNLKENLPIVLFDENLQTRDSQCCVCLGEFEIKEELHQIPLCKHVFHVDCIRLWLHSNSTCPLCRCPINIATAKQGLTDAPLGSSLIRGDNENFNHSPEDNVSQEQQEQVVSVVLNIESMSQIEGSSSGSTSFCYEYEMGYPSIQTRST